MLSKEYDIKMSVMVRGGNTCRPEACSKLQAEPLERYMPKERESFKYKLWRVVVSSPFEYFIMTLIVVNTVLLMMKVSHKRWRLD